MADVCTEMIFHYSGRFDELAKDGEYVSSFLSGVQGPTNRTRQFKTANGFGIFGVYFYPHALTALFNIPADAVRNEMPDLLSLLGIKGRMLEETMLAATSNQQRKTIIEQFLLSCLPSVKQEPAIFAAMQQIIREQGLVQIGELGAKYFLSQRQFERKFRTATGFTPKLFSRIVRFHSALHLYGKKDWRLTDIAHHCGYYDQSHFIHDFLAFSGQHPRKYFSGVSGATAWKDHEE
ncbi:AraC family transcriptional regulator [Nostoc ellipsosporum NOK]|nr:AraC family transcriptional regulator [Nostoc ellipsosporum NOK]